MERSVLYERFLVMKLFFSVCWISWSWALYQRVRYYKIGFDRPSFTHNLPHCFRNVSFGFCFRGLPTVLVVWSVFWSFVCPRFSVSPRWLSAITKTCAWVSLGWLTNGVVFLTSIVEEVSLSLSLSLYLSKPLILCKY